MRLLKKRLPGEQHSVRNTGSIGKSGGDGMGGGCLGERRLPD